jgi:hypothetical protein
VRRALPVAALLVCALALCSCGDTLQNTPLGASPFESVIVNSRFPVYWLGLRFDGLQASNVREDPGGAVTIDYGNCLIGGQYTCVTPLTIVTSPDNSFVPGAGAHRLLVRGLAATAVHGEATLAIRIGPVVVSVYARSASLARDAARTMGPLNEPGIPEAPLPPATADTGFDRLPLRSQVPHGQGVAHLPGP